jgi:hypothetical protein
MPDSKGSCLYRKLHFVCITLCKRSAAYGKSDENLQPKYRIYLQNNQNKFPRTLFHENALFYPILSTKNLSLLSLTNYRLQPTNYCKNMLNHRAKHEKKKRFLLVEKISQKRQNAEFQLVNPKIKQNNALYVIGGVKVCDFIGC